MDPKSRVAYEIVRASWVDMIKYHGFSEEYDRHNYEQARSHWTQYTDGDDWHAAGIAAHRDHWAVLGYGCSTTGCGLHDDDTADDGGVTAADFVGEGVYRPETDPAKIRAAKESLAALRNRLNQPTPW